jgi:putative FmdB family regulatory protein
MPIYVYKCKQCGLRFERFQRVTEDPVGICPECSGEVRRVFQPVGIVFKGSGFYATDNRKTSSLGSAKSNHKDDNGSGAKEKSDTAEPAKATADKATVEKATASGESK